MTVSNRGTKNRGAVYIGLNQGPKPEDIGNRQSFEQVMVPPDDVGNRVERDQIQSIINDNLGNTLEGAPAHLKSGILTQMLTRSPRANTRKRNQGSTKQNTARQVKLEPIEKMSEELAQLFSSQDYMENLIQEFALLLKNKNGQPFSFSMNAPMAAKLDANEEEAILSSFKNLIDEVLSCNDLEAKTEMIQYNGPKNKIAVYFITPDEADALKNKELISALRQTLNAAASLIIKGGVNIFLALSNAQEVIEEHLFKLGAKRTE